MIDEHLSDRFAEIENEFRKKERYLGMIEGRLETAFCWSNKAVIRREIWHARHMIKQYERLQSLYVTWRIEEGYFLDEATLQGTRESCDRIVGSLRSIIEAAEYAMGKANRKT